MANRNNLLIFILTIGVFGILNTEMGIVGALPSIACLLQNKSTEFCKEFVQNLTA